MARIPPVPRFSAVLKGMAQLIEYHWDNWFQGLANALNVTAASVGRVMLTTQSATVTTQPLTMQTLSQGLYRITYYARITRPASSSSSLTPSFNWTDGGVACSITESALTGNLTTTTGARVVPMQIDAATSPTYTLTYASTGGTTMQFEWTAELEALP
jgi:hypothetical protein